MIDSECDAAADRHQAETAPLQTELAKLNGNPKNAAPRGELMAAIASENVKLESAIEIGKRTKQKLDQQIRGIEQQCGNSQVLQNQLADLAAPELLDRQFVLQEQMKFIQLRLANAQEYVAKNADRLRRAEQEHNSANQRVYARRLRQWRADATDASESLATCHRELAELRAKMLSE